MTLTSEHDELLSRTTAKKLVMAVCALVLGVTLYAGFSPFTPHLKNEVHWLDGQNGLYFGEYASILSSAPLALDGPPDGPCTVELWLQPGLLDDSNTMLAFQTPESPLRFRIEQNESALRFDRQESGRYPEKGAEYIWMAGVVEENKPILITVTGGRRGTTVYLNGVLARSAPEFHLVRRDLTGGIVVGNSAVDNDSWSGILRGIGIYNQELSADQVRKNYEDWTRTGQPATLDSASAVYPFSEHSGNTVHNLVHNPDMPGADLYIPDYYLVLYPEFLEPVWRSWGFNWAFWKDCIVNVVGFMPFGFAFCVYFALTRPLKRAVLLSIVLGSAISLLIETTQYYLPTRDSETIDFLNNCIGTSLGAFCCLPGFVQNLLARLGMAPFSRQISHSSPSMSPETAAK